MITHLNLRNFKCFEEEGFDLAPLTLFTGINGMGKSSVIQSLLLLKQSFARKVLQNESKVVLENNSFVDLENCGELCYKKAYPKEIEVALENDSGNNYRWRIDAKEPDAVEAPFVYEGESSYQHESLFKNSFLYLSAERIGPRKLYGKLNTERTYNTRLGIQGELTPAFIQKSVSENAEVGIKAIVHPSLLPVEGTGIKDDSSKGLYVNINAWLTDILGKGITAKVSDVDKENVRLTFGMKGALGDDFSALQVGFGYSFALPVIVAPLIAKPGDMLIIENPEAHLHPSAQSKVGNLLALAAQNGVQVVIETHSDHLLNGIRVAVKKGILDAGKTEIHFFTGEPGKKVSFAIEEDGALERWPQGFFDEWDNMLTELIKD